jgi:hypothetical protein
LICWGSLAEKAQVAAQACYMTGLFGLLDYGRRASAGGGAPKSDFVSSNFGFRIRWTGSDWRTWAALDKESPSAVFGAVSFDDAALFVSAAFLKELEPHPEAIYSAFENLLGATLDGMKSASRRDITQGKFSGIETQVRLQSTRNEDLTYRIRILHGGGVAYLVAAWTKTADPRRDQILADALTRVELPEAPPPVVPPSRFTEAEKRGQRMFFNQVGMFYFNAGQFEPASRFFKAALDLEGDRTDTPYLANLVQAWSRLGRYREALEAMEKHPHLVETRADLQADHAFLQSETGQADLALTNYAKLFASGYRDEGHFKQYIGLLSLAERHEQALAEVERFLQARDTAEVRLLLACLNVRRNSIKRSPCCRRSVRKTHSMPVWRARLQMLLSRLNVTPTRLL